VPSFDPPDLASTTELIGLARGGDRGAIDQLFSRLYPPLRRWTRGRLPGWARDLTDTDDLVQESLVQTFKHLETFDARGAGALQAYVRQAILNRIRDQLRRVARRPLSTPLTDAEVDDALSPLEQAIGAEAVARYERALERLKPRDREAVIARIELGFDYDELADLLGTPTADAARKAAERAIQRLAAEMTHDADQSARR
jgi:RNA polymerase sigma-70 factor (ECF subfamily)